MGISSNSHGHTLGSTDSCTRQPNADASQCHTAAASIPVSTISYPDPQTQPTQDQNVIPAPSGWEVLANGSWEPLNYDPVYDLNKWVSLSSWWAVQQFTQALPSSPSILSFLSEHAHIRAPPWLVNLAQALVPGKLWLIDLNETMIMIIQLKGRTSRINQVYSISK